MSPTPLSAGLVAAAVVASAKAYGDDPMAAYGPGTAKQRRAATAAAVALVGHTGQPYKAVCNLLQVHTTSYSRAASQMSPPFKGALQAASAALAEICAPAETPVDPAPAVRAPPPPKPGPISAARALLPNNPAPASAALKAATAVVHQLPPPATSRAKNTRPTRSGSAYGRANSLRLKPVEGRRLRFCKRFLAANWPLEEVAYLFDVSADALAIATRGYAARPGLADRPGGGRPRRRRSAGRRRWWRSSTCRSGCG
ncbi:MAG: hypothetical protein GC145_18715 [Caulobacter sp.]|nr:hypothetical protein [Caulobacter sp.]